MKKRIFSLFLAFIIVMSASAGAFASDGFNKSVFDNATDVYVVKDDMTGDFIVTSESLLGSNSLITPISGNGHVNAYLVAGVTDDLNMISFSINYYADDWAFINKVIFKIGTKRYTFSNLDVKRSVQKNATISENCNFEISSKSLPMMSDFIEHRDEEIKVRLQGQSRNVDFILTDAMKNGIINIWNLYVAGGGTSHSSMEKIDLISNVGLTIAQD